MELLYVFPHLNAILNASAGVFLICGLYCVLTNRIHAHRFCMLTACTISCLFLISYVTHHAMRTYYFGLGPTKFTGTGLARPIYFTILTSHTILAALIGPFVVAAGMSDTSPIERIACAPPSRSRATMPNDSWPRCWSEYSPRCVRWTASGCP